MLRILHTPYNEANNPRGLCDAECELGYNSRLEILHNDGYFDTADRTWANNSLFNKEIMRWPLMIYALLFYDIIHYNFGSFLSPIPILIKGRFSFLKKLYNILYAKPLQGIDLKLSSLLNRRVFVTFQGSDGRIIDYCKKNYKWHFGNEPNANHKKDDDYLRLEKIALFDKYAERIFTVNPDLLNTLPKRASFVPYSSVKVEKIKTYLPNLKKKDITIVHAPSNRSVKGTKYLLSAVEKLKKENYNFKFYLVEGLTNIQALEIYKKADIVIEQLLAGWYGAFAVEVMAMGKPVIAYIRESDLVHIPDLMYKELPIINATPETIYSVLKYYLESSKKKLYNIGKASREYVLKWHNPKNIAKIILKKNKKNYYKVK